MREAARRVMLDEKAYSIVANEVVDAAMARAGMDANGRRLGRLAGRRRGLP